MAGIRFVDYRVTSPAAVQFDPTMRQKELAALGSATAQTLCTANPQSSLILSAPTITFDGASAQILEVSYQSGSTTVVQEFLNLEWNNFSASNGYSSRSLGLKMTRNRGDQQYYIAFHPGNPGLENITDLTNEINYYIDPTAQTATFKGPLTGNTALNQALFGVFLHLDSILKSASFTTQPAASGQPLWTAADLVTLATQAGG